MTTLACTSPKSLKPVVLSVWRYLVEYIHSNDYAPTTTEIFSSNSFRRDTQKAALDWLESRCLIRREPNRWRNIRLTRRRCEDCGEVLEPSTAVFKTDRYLSLRSCCKSCWNAKYRNWYQRNRDLVLRNNARWYHKNRNWWNELRNRRYQDLTR